MKKDRTKQYIGKSNKGYSGCEMGEISEKNSPGRKSTIAFPHLELFFQFSKTILGGVTKFGDDGFDYSWRFNFHGRPGSGNSFCVMGVPTLTFG